MKTVTHILNTEPDLDLPKVVDLEAWKAEHLDRPARGAERKPVRRRWTALDWAELAATLAVAAAFAALAVRVLLF